MPLPDMPLPNEMPLSNEMNQGGQNSGTALPRRISILGATGSIGGNTLDVLKHQGGRDAFDIVALTGNSNIDELAREAIAWNAHIAVTADPDRYGALKDALSGSGIEAAAGEAALIEAASREVDWVMAGIIGLAGLAPTLAAIRKGTTIALANKECLVSAGDLFLKAIEQAGAALLPVDSEHNAIHQVLQGQERCALERLILTASGGPFRDWSKERLAKVTPDQAAAHPNWSMGQKISIDSASLFNKALEMIEAKHLFQVEPSQIEVIVHPQSVIHSMVGYSDGSILAQLGPPDMRTAIGYALTWPARASLPVERLDFGTLAHLDFEPPDQDRFPALKLARQAMERGGLAGTVLNGAKETALDAFLEGRIGFLDMADITGQVMDELADLGDGRDLDDVFDADKTARAQARARC